MVKPSAKPCTGFLWDDCFANHSTGSLLPGVEHFETAATKYGFFQLLATSGLLKDLVRFTAPVPAPDEALLSVHTPEYIALLQGLDATGGDAGEEAPFAAGGYAIAKRAVGGILAMTDAILEGRIKNGYALVRPPGHHAERDRGRGFCLLANVAIAVKHIQAKVPGARVAVVDYDVHAGNSTTSIFYDDPSVLVISIHQDRAYPYDSNHITENGSGPGVGYTINIPLPAGSGSGAYADAFDRVIVPALNRFAPDFIFVSSGFDASFMDPLGCMALGSHDFRGFVERIMAVARVHCQDRVLCCHEGGYSTAYVPFCGLEVMKQLSGIEVATDDPFAWEVKGMPAQALTIDQAVVVSKAARLVKNVEDCGRVSEPSETYGLPKRFLSACLLSMRAAIQAFVI